MRGSENTYETKPAMSTGRATLLVGTEWCLGGEAKRLVGFASVVALEETQ